MAETENAANKRPGDADTPDVLRSTVKSDKADPDIENEETASKEDSNRVKKLTHAE